MAHEIALKLSFSLHGSPLLDDCRYKAISLILGHKSFVDFGITAVPELNCVRGEYNLPMVRAALVALLLASPLTPPLEAQRASAGFRGFSKAPGQSAQVGQRGLSNGRFPVHFHHRDRLGVFFSPYFLPDDETYWSEEPGPQPVGSEPTPQVFYASPERERPLAVAQIVEIPGAANQKQMNLPLPTIFVLANGERLETLRFVVTVSSLSLSIDRCERVIPLEAVDLVATTAANRERGINLRIPDDRNEILLGF